VPGAACQAHTAPVVVADLSAVTFLDSTGISTLLRAHNALTAQGGWLALTGADQTVLRVLDLTGVDTVIPTNPPRPKPRTPDRGTRDRATPVSLVRPVPLEALRRCPG